MYDGIEAVSSNNCNTLGFPEEYKPQRIVDGLYFAHPPANITMEGDRERKGSSGSRGDYFLSG